MLKPDFQNAKVLLSSLKSTFPSDQEDTTLSTAWKALSTLVDEFSELTVFDFYFNIKMNMVKQLRDLEESISIIKNDGKDTLPLNKALVKVTVILSSLFSKMNIYICWQATFFGELKFYLNELAQDEPTSKVKEVYTEIVGIIYKLHQKYFSKENYAKISMLNYYEFFFNNFHSLFNSNPAKNHVFDCLTDVSVQRFNFKDELTNLIKGSFFKPNTFVDSNSFYFNFTTSAINNYYNKRLINWKSRLLDSKLVYKCRICEFDIKGKLLIQHSTKCLEEQSVKDKLLKMNVDLKKIKEDVERLNL